LKILFPLLIEKSCTGTVPKEVNWHKFWQFVRQMVKELIVSNYIVKKTKELVKLKGILCTPNFKLINILKDEIKS